MLPAELAFERTFSRARDTPRLEQQAGHTGYLEGHSSHLVLLEATLHRLVEILVPSLIRTIALVMISLDLWRIGTDITMTNMDQDQSSDGTLEEVKDAVEHLDEVQHHAIDKAQALAEAQGQQTNEIGRYLHELGEVMDSNRKDHYNELLTLHEDIGKIRDQIAQGGLHAQTEVKIIAPPEEAPPKLPPKTTPVPVQASQVPDILTPAPPPAQTSVSVNVPVQAPPAAIMSVHEHSEDGGSPVMHSRKHTGSGDKTCSNRLHKTSP